jgi:Na+/H+-translocating membrane pyrophosphatase
MTDGGGAWLEAAKHIERGEQLVRSGALAS